MGETTVTPTAVFKKKLRLKNHLPALLQGSSYHPCKKIFEGDVYEKPNPQVLDSAASSRVKVTRHSLLQNMRNEMIFLMNLQSLDFFIAQQAISTNDSPDTWKSDRKNRPTAPHMPIYKDIGTKPSCFSLRPLSEASCKTYRKKKSPQVSNSQNNNIKITIYTKPPTTFVSSFLRPLVASFGLCFRR